MSDEMEYRRFEALESELSEPETDGVGVSEFDEVRNALLAAIEELGLGTTDPEHTGSPEAGCCLSIVPVDRHGHGGVVVSWLLRDPAVPGGTGPLGGIESVEILNEALGPVLLALGFPIEPYAVDGRWIVTGSRGAG